MLTRRVFLTVIAMAATASKALAHSFKIGEIAIGHVWGLPSETRETQVFVPLSNRGKEADALVAARSAICSMIELRQNNRYDDPALISLTSIVADPAANRSRCAKAPVTSASSASPSRSRSATAST
jgi:hypothetical protein